MEDLTMSKRQWILGIGMGMMIGASLLQVGTLTQAKPPEPAESKPPTPAPIQQPQVKTWLQENGYAFVKQADWDAQTKKISELENRPAPLPTITVYINPGLSVAGMESLFVKSGLLSKENTFAVVIGEKGLSRKVRSGVYTFEGNQTAESIVSQITNETIIQEEWGK